MHHAIVILKWKCKSRGTALTGEPLNPHPRPAHETSRASVTPNVPISQLVARSPYPVACLLCCIYSRPSQLYLPIFHQIPRATKDGRQQCAPRVSQYQTLCRLTSGAIRGLDGCRRRRSPLQSGQVWDFCFDLWLQGSGPSCPFLQASSKTIDKRGWRALGSLGTRLAPPGRMACPFVALKRSTWGQKYRPRRTRKVTEP